MNLMTSANHRDNIFTRSFEKLRHFSWPYLWTYIGLIETLIVFEESDIL